MLRKRFGLTLIFMVILALVVPVGSAAQGSGVTLLSCSKAVHDKYKAPGPDGAMYSTWHPTIDLANGCYHNHEHGSNPATFFPGAGYAYKNLPWPVFGYTSSKAGMSESHAGFKVYVFDGGGYRWMITHHFGTASASTAACVQFHTLDVQVRDMRPTVALSRTLIADVHLMADYGKSVFNRTSAPFTPTNCLTNPQIPGTGVRLFPGMWDDVGYEPWRVATGATVFGFDVKSLTINTNDPQTACVDMACDASVPRVEVPGTTWPARGTVRFVTLYAGFGFTDNALRGEFYTDASGKNVLQVGDAGAVHQYIAPGFVLTLPALQECWAFGLDYSYICSSSSDLRNFVDQSSYQKNLFVEGGN